MSTAALSSIFTGDDAFEGQGHSGGVQVSHPVLHVVPVGHAYLDQSRHGWVGQDVHDVRHGISPGGAVGFGTIFSHLRQVHGQVVGEPAVPGPEDLRLRGLGVPHDAEPVGGGFEVNGPVVPYPQFLGGA